MISKLMLLVGGPEIRVWTVYHSNLVISEHIYLTLLHVYTVCHVSLYNGKHTHTRNTHTSLNFVSSINNFSLITFIMHGQCISIPRK